MSRSTQHRQADTGLKRFGRFLYTLIIVGALLGTSYQIYRVSTGKVKSAIPIANQVQKQNLPQEKALKPAQTPQVQEILSAQPVAAAQLGDDNRIIFRSFNGDFYCSIARRLDKDLPGLLTPVTTESGVNLKGEGVVCGTIYNQPNIGGPLVKCDNGVLNLDQVALWKDNVAVGACVQDRPPLSHDVSDHLKAPTSAERFKAEGLGVDQYTKLGSYACKMGSLEVTCANIETGQGFKLGSSTGYEVF